MEIEITCLECGKRTRRFEMGPAAFTLDGCDEIVLRDRVICPKCKLDISEGKCVTPAGSFLVSLLALTVGMFGEEEGTLRIPPHLMGLAIVSREQYEALKRKGKASIRLAKKL